MAKLSADEIAAARRQGADVKVIPKQVTVNGLQDLVAQMQAMQDSSRKGQAVMLAAIQQLTEVIREKQVSTGTDLSGLIAAVEGLHKDTADSYAPVEWELTFERDNRNMLKSGMRFSPVQPILN